MLKRKRKQLKEKKQQLKRRKKQLERKVEAARQNQELAGKETDQLDRRLRLKRKRTSVGTNKKRVNDTEPGESDVNVDMYRIQNTEFNNQCCVCFRTYEDDQLEQTGLQWVQCVCKRWVHEDCYEVLTDKDGRELICPYCVR